MVSVGENNRFDYGSVWENQKQDVHPPFYYTIIHTISSFFPNEFCINGGIILNVFCSVILTILLYFIGSFLWKDRRYALFLTGIWAVSFGNMNQIVFLRMYLMLTVMMVSALLLHLYYSEKRKDWKFYTFLVGISVLGALTHYYYIMFLFFLAAVFGINMIFKHKWKEAVLYIIALVIAGITSILIFPSMITHIFFGYRGKGSFDNMFHISDILGRLKWYFLTIDKQLFGGLLIVIIAIAALAVLVHLTKNKNGKEIIAFFWKEEQITREGMIFLVVLGYYVLVSKSSVMLFDRYIMPIYPLILIFLCSIIFYVKKLFSRFQPIYAYIFVLAIAVFGLFTQKMEYLYRDSLQGIEYAKENASKPAIVVCMYDLRMNAVYPELMQYDNLIVITPDEIEQLRTNELNGYENLIIYELTSDIEVSQNIHKEVDLKQILNICPNLSTYYKQYEQYKENDYITVKVYELK